MSRRSSRGRRRRKEGGGGADEGLQVTREWVRKLVNNSRH